jgi:hypothetical protein
MALLIFAGAWLTGLRALSHLIDHFPLLLMALRTARAAGESTGSAWGALISAAFAVLLGGIVLLISLLFLLLVEGTQIITDDVGLAVEIYTLPAPLARRFGAGRLTWKRIQSVRRRLFFFRLKGSVERAEKEGELEDPTLRFLMVDELERLLLMVLERSPNLKWDE